MNVRLKWKYRTYTGDGPGGLQPKTQYSNGRTGNGNGKRPAKVARPTNRFTGNNPAPKTMVVNGLTGHRVME